MVERYHRMLKVPHSDRAIEADVAAFVAGMMGHSFRRNEITESFTGAVTLADVVDQSVTGGDDNMEFHLHLHVDGLAEILVPLGTSILTKLNSMESQMTSDFQSLVEQVHQTRSVAASAVALINGFVARMDAAGEDPAAIRALKQELIDATSPLAAAVVANTPASDPNASINGGIGQAGGDTSTGAAAVDQSTSTVAGMESVHQNTVGSAASGGQDPLPADQQPNPTGGLTDEQLNNPDPNNPNPSTTQGGAA